MTANVAVWSITGLATLAVILRPWRLPEALWVTIAVLLLMVLGLLPAETAWAGIRNGGDVYLFLAGMMLLAEIARREGLFDWLAELAVAYARGSARRLFILIYIVGVLVTTFLSNDATAVVLTPAVYAAARTAKAAPLPYLLICAFVANAASFVLPISNPANLVVYDGQMPPLLEWIGLFGLPSVAAILSTFVLLRWTQSASLRGTIAASVDSVALSLGGRIAGIGVAVAAVVLLIVSLLGMPLGWPTCAAALVTAAAVLLCKRESPLGVIRNVQWSVLPLVAGLFILVEALAGTGLLDLLDQAITRAAAASQILTAWGVGLLTGFGSNLVNNLPAALIAGTTVNATGATAKITGATLIGIDLGPNLSVTGSLATILWLAAIRREGLEIRARGFLKFGFIVMPPALLLALAVFIHF
jgi:arsenical pump membrane protein